MLVLNGDRRGIPDPELVVLARLREWNGPAPIGGVALSGAFLPGDGAAGESDLVVITPTLCVVIEVKAITGPVGGTLSCPPDRVWSMPGIEGDPVPLRRNDMNPLDQAHEGVFLARTVAAEAGNRGAFIAGLVLVLPQPGHELVLDRGSWSDDTGVHIGLLEDLPRWFQRYDADRPICWTAEQVHALLSILNHAGDITVEDLVEQGFRAESHGPSTWRGDPFSWLDNPTPAPPELSWAEPAPLPSRFVPTAEPPRRQGNPLLAGVIALCATVIVGLLVYVNLHLGAAPQDSGAAVPISAPPATPSAPVDPSHPATLPGCFPFQPDC